MNLFPDDFYTVGRTSALGGLGAAVSAEDWLRVTGSPITQFTQDEIDADAARVTAVAAQLKAQAAADTAYNAVIAARNAAAPAAAAALVFDDTGRATDASVARANAIQTAAAAPAQAKLEQAQQAVAKAAAVTQAVLNAPVTSTVLPPPFVSDADIAAAAHSLLMQGLGINDVVVALVKQFGINNARAMPIANAEYAKVYTQASQPTIQPRPVSPPPPVVPPVFPPPAQVSPDFALQPIYTKQYPLPTINRAAKGFLVGYGPDDAPITQPFDLKAGDPIPANWQEDYAFSTQPATVLPTTPAPVTPTPTQPGAAAGIAPLLLAAAAAYFLGS